MERWGQFHCDLKDLTSWLTEAEVKLQDSKNANGELDEDRAKAYQKVKQIYLNLVVLFMCTLVMLEVLLCKSSNCKCCSIMTL